MNTAQSCPQDSVLSDLLNGNLMDPELSVLAEHVEHCLLCQQKVEHLSAEGALSIALLGDSLAYDKIDNQTPLELVERIKQIPRLAAVYADAGSQGSSLSSSSLDSVSFSADSTMGGLGKLGPYRILKLLGSGGMGSVFLAEDSKLHRHVALKVMLPKIAADPVAKQRFLREARTAASLKSDHIVTVHQVDEDNDIPYLAMELLQGRSLDEAVRSGDEMRVDTIVHVGLGVAKGLADAHEKGMIHRDIKPGNIWLESTDEGLPRIKIVDFGLARMDADDMHLTHASAIVGTPAFMAPEQARGESSVDARSDLFSLGCVLYYLCTGEVPFKAESMLGTLMALAADTPDSPATRNALIPLRLSRLTMQLLEKDPSKRPQTAREVAADLREVKRELDSGVAEFAQPDVFGTLAHSKDSKELKEWSVETSQRWPGIAAAVGLLAVVGLALSPSLRAPDAPSALSLTKARPEPALKPSSETTPAANPEAKLDAKPADDLAIAWAEQANQRFQRLNADFMASNSRFQGVLRPVIDADEIVGLTITGKNVANLDALRGLKSLRSLVIEGGSTWEMATIDVSAIHELPLNIFGLHGGYVIADLTALKGMPLQELSLDYSPVADLTPLAGMQLRQLMLWSWSGNDLTPLRGMPIERLNIGGNGQPIDLAPLAGAPLDFLCVNVSQVSDLSPLKGMPLRSLYCSNTLVADLSPVQDVPIEELIIRGTLVKDITLAKGMPLKWIEIDYELPNWHQCLKDIPSLTRINDQPAATLLTEFDPERRPVRKVDFVNSLGMEFALVPAGKTLRGTGNFDQYVGDRPIEIDRDFYLGRYEVTQEEWVKVMGTNPSYFSRQGPGANKVKWLSDAELARLPVERVSWLDCQVFLEKLNQLDSDSVWSYRLPTEAEWTYACQEGPMPADFDREHTFYFDKPTKTLVSYKANTKLYGLQRPCKVGIYAPNRLGLYDMHGNVFEWCNDLANVPDKRARWIHGGGWQDDAERCKVANLLEPTEPWTYYDLGLRVARVRK
ncbi:MAG: SUMF1/EgtB/PvdO family nonheme iron enzyme [Pirellulaceae bacterium]|nr:SUMF1/EgtB/PvdO family nonheme iron enzyme [Pirellulaceae bacterium]